MKRGVILLEEAASASSTDCGGGSGASRSLWSGNRMIDMSGAAPGGLLFAVYFSPGGGDGLFSSCSSHGLVTTPCEMPGVMESGVCSFAGNVGLEMCWLDQALSAIIETLKASGCVLLVGVGGVLCYKLYNAHKERIVAGLRACFHQYHHPFGFLDLNLRERGQLVRCAAEGEEVEEDLFDLLEIDFTVGLNCLSSDHRPKRKMGRGVYQADQIRTRWRHVTGRTSSQFAQATPPVSARRNLPLRKFYSTPEGLVRLQDAHKSAQSDSFRSARDRLYGGALKNSFSGLSSLEVSPCHSSPLHSYGLSAKDPRFQGDTTSWSQWDGSVDSVGGDVSEVSRLIREYSVDSDCSDLSLEFNDGFGLSTLQVIERIEAEINSVKNNCLAMNQELYTLNDACPTGGDAVANNTSSADADSSREMSSSENIPPLLTRASFKGVLNLTTIPDEISDSASDSSAHLRPLECEEDPFSMEWDNEDFLVSLEQDNVTANGARAKLPLSKSGSLLKVPAQPNQEVWCSQESGYLDWTEPHSEASASVSGTAILSPLPEKREMDSMSFTTAYSSCLNSPDDSVNDLSTSSGYPVEQPRARRRQWAETSKQNRDSAIFDVGLDLEAAWSEEAVGATVQLHSYAHDTWQALTPRAHAIKQAYVEVERMTHCRRMRRMRGDNYSILRAVLCQMVMKGLSLPSAREAIQCIYREMTRGSHWLRGWTFGHRLPYGPDNVVEGMQQCLETLDHLMAELADEKDPMESLVSRLNADVLLDIRLMEAIKLHVLSAALNLELTSSLGEALPLFALALFSRPDSKDAKALALNYLNPIGDSTSIDRAEFYLLGYALGVRIDVYRPTAITLKSDENMDLRTSYPDWESFSSFISVIEEDDRHYSVPVP